MAVDPTAVLTALDRLGFEHEQVVDADAVHHWTASLDQIGPLHLVVSRSLPEQLAILRGTTVDAQLAERLRGTTDEVRRKLTARFKLTLQNLELEYAITKLREEDTFFDRFLVLRVLLAEEVDAPRLRRALLAVNNGTVAFITLVEEMGLRA